LETNVNPNPDIEGLVDLARTGGPQPAARRSVFPLTLARDRLRTLATCSAARIVILTLDVRVHLRAGQRQGEHGRGTPTSAVRHVSGRSSCDARESLVIYRCRDITNQIADVPRLRTSG
jgi:hypothetical protein